jgi:hypothetical protein
MGGTTRALSLQTAWNAPCGLPHYRTFATYFDSVK